jgi:hypothetical protein
MNFTLPRDSDDGTATRGRWLLADGSELCKTLELPWADNHPDHSCISTGTFTCTWRMSEKHHVMKWHIKNVPGRAGVEIDIANLAKQLLGCIALGMRFGDVFLPDAPHGDGQPGILESGIAYAKLLATVGAATSFTLTILPIPTAPSAILDVV